MPSGIYFGFDFGFKRIGVAVGQKVTLTARPLTIIQAQQGIPNWELLRKLIKEWRPEACVVGLPTCIDDTELYTTEAAKRFAKQLQKQFCLPVHLVDERLSTKEARAYLFEEGGYRKIQSSQIDSIAACIILQQWLHSQQFKSES
ncbi:putative ribonuclease [Legionella busanensis]|uniref:Putative pre-16S rRNA nuclease n=1 Tax=Legionella busanensis TaxID=190655 RepID=A0A378JHK1_9GAMM|nr:Holliday junction resolvase RuvX [Legionella busanensis]STX50614.1 putative ribonuclease [Legionella busanensis]